MTIFQDSVNLRGVLRPQTIQLGLLLLNLPILCVQVDLTKGSKIDSILFLELPRIILLGMTGSGKSTLGNALLDEPSFTVGRDMESCTSETSHIQKGVWSEKEFEVIDTPGSCFC